MLSKGRLRDNSVLNRRQSMLRSVRMREVAKWKTEILERGSDLEGGLVRRWKIFARSTEFGGDDRTVCGR